MNTIIMIPVATAIVSLLVGTGIGYAIRKHSWEQKAQNAQNDADHILADARARKKRFLKLKNKFVILGKKPKMS